MRAGELQAAMHSLKDVPGNEETPGLVIAATLPRDAANDSLVLRPGLSLETFLAARGKGFKIGTNAVRRAAYLRRLFPEVTVIHYRGAADTRDCKTRSRRHAAASRWRRSWPCGCAGHGALRPRAHRHDVAHRA